MQDAFGLSLDEFVLSVGYPGLAHLMNLADKLDSGVYCWREPSRGKEEMDKEVDLLLAVAVS